MNQSARGDASAGLRPAEIALKELMAYYGREMTTLETMGWLRLIDQYGDERMVAFLTRHMQSSVFAPKLSEALDMLSPGLNNATAALEAVREEVVRVGPYGAPSFEDPAIPRAIKHMGGWVAVNEQLPDPSDRFGYEAFLKRFEACYSRGCAEHALDRGGPPRLSSLHSLSLPAPSLDRGGQDSRRDRREPLVEGRA